MQKINFSNIAKCLITTSCILILTSCAGYKPPDALSKIEAFKPTTAIGISSIRLLALEETARGTGAKAGLAWRAKQIDEMLSKNEKHLTKVFNFHAMLLPNNVLPPILAEGINTLNLANNYTIRLADKDYQIISPPRFVTAAPTWRDYLWMNFQTPEQPNATLLPKNTKERTIWNHYIVLGWNEGVEQANDIFSANLGRLKRDYEGMILYKKLHAQNIVSAPFVSKANLGITGGGNKMRVNDRVLRITAIPQLQTNSKYWKPALSNNK